MARIAIVLNTSWNVWNFRLPLLHALERAGHEIIVIAPHDEYVGRIPFPCHHVDIRSRSTNPFVDMMTIWGFFRVFQRLRPDIALLYTVKPNVYGNLAAKILGIKTISNVAGLGAVFIHKSLVTLLVKKLYRASLRVPSRVFFQNQDDLSLFLEEKIVCEECVGKIPGSGVDLVRFKPVQLPKNELFVFLLPSRMLWDKGVREYVDAAHLLLKERYAVEFRLMGFLDVDNPEAVSKSDMDGLTNIQGLVYAGVSDQIEEDLAKADCVVLPSYREGTPRALLEAAAMAKPIITTDAVGCRDVVDDGVSGFLCKVADTGDLYKKMKKMLQLSAVERLEMGLQGRRKMEREFDQEIVIASYEQAVADILAEK
ncbi:Lipid carrier : UDP-N-acetylgalactosaminyltransferase / Alpha-1,3-N-acetylgalactosamine transferase PglA; Putative glycosyltransferase [hydrothermal vent metagenome]|uniref:Lipid carrier: UDP-N-acetylgalactosaminyltransferase / Alpha-1,3-N-acetylgalactosamine transferase PglA Putative glycosyltransferase n=1 Tax=hydrothermal vent metagenome TaxID=652676 RepID=A0A3B1BJ36_9ZZZZ